jgi:histidinol-phosphate phosphatase family protein
MQAVIVAGGSGSRMSAKYRQTPKCLLRIGDKSILEHCFLSLSQTKVQKVSLLLSKHAEVIKIEAERLALKYNFSISFSIQNELLGTGGSILAALDQLDDKFILVYGDLFLNTNLNGLCDIGDEVDVDFAQIVHPSSHMFDSDIVEIDSSASIVRYHIKPHSEDLIVRNLCNAGVYFFRKEVFASFPSRTFCDLDREILPEVIKLGFKGRALRHTGIIRDAGTPERLEELQRITDRKIFSPEKTRAVFLDRDGTLIYENGYLTKPSDLHLHSDSTEVVKRCNELGILTFVVTNQPAIARGLITELELFNIHNHMDRELAKAGAWIDDYSYCPHHPDSGFPEEIAELKITCLCRKPNTKLFERVIEYWAIDVQNSAVVGNSWRDRGAADALGIRYFEVAVNSNSLGSALDSNGVSFVDWITGSK